MKQVTVFYGAPGSRKSTLGDAAAMIGGTENFDMGRHLKEGANRNIPFCVEARMQVSRGILISDRAICAYLNENRHLILSGVHKTGFGYCVGVPRTASQCIGLMKILREASEDIRIVAIHVDTPREICVHSIFGRSESEDRSDDRDQSAIDKRFSEYDENSAFVLDFMQQYFDEFRTVDGTNMRSEAPMFIRQLGLPIRDGGVEAYLDSIRTDHPDCAARAKELFSAA